jgi:hypothetical protein
MTESEGPEMTTPELEGTRWRKSSCSGANANCVEVAAVWRTSTRSGVNSNCVEVAPGVGEVAVRDSKNPTGHVLILNGAQWTTFLDALKNGTFNPA